MGENFEWPNTYWFIAERTNGRLAMIGFMAVIINYALFGWIAYPIL
ncbi:high light inducible protein [Prochlorococcus marinus str. XMU1401]|nr:high light inducible protein [Prochlorococcus marinus str. XMU1401E]PJC83672.1 high light inducible protein [Prochlorococcus marinus str. XMU1401]